ncbi:uncharacterized protein Nmag_0154 [Natrialba magadii ATCC 43099]|uniref:Uncharacterized protein n=1 Tax=Natrialba magadii (strain ATCC 43099 / DSM 3394 / CCM 3739 / CIP 104546 / IAM 13178 / JCM 8861 / NBRC 102185 / NCIMB 2190 / MS3) TaxID=547559 RepID=D3SWF4_NATMM|nr:hypothetical protein [Natrialba magadii]ADD03746.1 uncharacterized protein Nmag_0154 [Natrialba magadii ATCC 43099]ELY33802.1 hypothetical protein C500_01213 [Natrialba magadii ATCC 43099]
MSNDETRGNQSPDRQDAPIDPNQPLQTHLEYIDSITRALLARTTPPNASAVDHLEPDQRRELRRHLRQIRAEASRVGLLAIGPEASMPYRPDTANVLTYSGPEALPDIPDDHSAPDQSIAEDQPSHDTADDQPSNASDDTQPSNTSDDDHDTRGEPDE